MTILLLTRENSSYNATTKEFTFNLDKQLEERVKHIRFQTFSFRPSTTFTDYPLACSEFTGASVLNKDTNHDPRPLHAAPPGNDDLGPAQFRKQIDM